MPKFTPGTWYVSHEINIRSATESGLFKYEICTCINDRDKTRLIASAPKLYAFIEKYSRSTNLSMSSYAESIITNIDTDSADVVSLPSWYWKICSDLTICEFNDDGHYVDEVCELCDGLLDDKDDTEMRANARLIASVPQCYHLVKRISELKKLDPEAQAFAEQARKLLLDIGASDPNPQAVDVEEMLPCSKCGSTHQVAERMVFSNEPLHYMIRCQNCKKMSSAICHSVKECVDSWNSLNAVKESAMTKAEAFQNAVISVAEWIFQKATTKALPYKLLKKLIDKQIGWKKRIGITLDFDELAAEIKARISKKGFTVLSPEAGEDTPKEQPASGRKSSAKGRMHFRLNPDDRGEAMNRFLGWLWEVFAQRRENTEMMFSVTFKDK